MLYGDLDVDKMDATELTGLRNAILREMGAMKEEEAGGERSIGGLD